MTTKTGTSDRSLRTRQREVAKMEKPSGRATAAPSSVFAGTSASGGRPPLALGRLQELPNGRVSIALRRPWSDGTTAFVLTAAQLAERLIACIPGAEPREGDGYAEVCPHGRAERHDLTKLGVGTWRGGDPEPAADAERVAASAEGRVDWRTGSGECFLWCLEAGVPESILVNPVITPMGDEKEEGAEHSLSAPGPLGWVPRWKNIRYTSFEERRHAIDHAVEGLHAHVVKHERDDVIGGPCPARIRDLTQSLFGLIRCARRNQRHNARCIRPVRCRAR